MSVYGFSQTFTLKKCLLLISLIHLVSGNQWYIGCAWSTITTSDPSYVVQENVAAIPTTCCSHCYQNGFEYAAVGNSTCWCGDNADTSFVVPDKVCNEICEVERPLLPCGSTEAVSIYNTQGPYLLSLALSKGSATVQTGVTSLFDARIELAGATDAETGITDIAVKDLQNVNFTWSINGSVVKNSVKPVTNTSSTSSLIYTFQQVGIWFIRVTASNTISHRTATTILHVVQPVPSDLQVILRPGQGNIPSCVPEHDNLMSNLPAVAVFVGEQAEFQAYLSIGINLTFDWWFGDDGSHVTSAPYLEDGESCGVIMCLHSHQAHVFEQEGLFTVTVNASNTLGSAQKTLHVIVMNRGIKNLSLTLVEGSHFTTPNMSLIFQLKMETADREQAFLSLDFDDEVVYNQSLRDVNETFISGGSANPANMYLTASYGDGCQLIVSFSHKYTVSGSYSPKTHIHSHGTAFLAELSEAIFVQRSIEGVQLESASSFPLGSHGSIWAEVPFKTNNMTYEWKVMLGNATVGTDVTQNGSFIQIFDSEGPYIVQVTVKNLVSQLSAVKVIRVQKAITGVSIRVPDGGFVVPLDQTVTFEVSTEVGTDPTFRWDFQNGSTYEDVGFVDASGSYIFSSVNHTFTEVGNYNVSITAWNLVSDVTQGLGQPMVVQEPISGLSAQSVSPALFNQTSQLAVTIMHGSHVKFSSDVNGKEEVLRSELREDGTFVMDRQLSEVGLHYMNITASNNVSEVSTEVSLLVQEPISNFSLHLLPLSLGKLALVTYFDGEPNSRGDIMYQWMLHGTNVTTASCSGIFIVEQSKINENSTLTASNLVDERTLHVNVPEDISESPFLLTNPHYVEVNTTTSFTLSLLSGQLMQKVEITYRYSSNNSETVTMPIASPILEVLWSHAFSVPGVWLLDIVGVDIHNETLQSTSVVSVQEKVRDISIVGPLLSRFVWPLTTLTWELRPSAGSSIMYDWEIIPLFSNSPLGSGDFKMKTGGTNILAYIPFSMPGTYNLTLTASNEISRTLTHTLTTLREPVTSLVLSSSPVLHGLNSTILLRVRGGLEFSFNVDFGDGTVNEVSSNSPEVSVVSVDNYTQPITYVFALRKHYAELGEYTVVATVSNGVSDMEGSTVVRVEERITGLTIVTSNSWLVNAIDNITVEATVATGNDIVFTWDFSDMSGPTTVIHTNGSYSAVIHTFGMPGEYYISVSARNALQQDPLIYHYPTPFVVQQVPEALELIVFEGNNWASLEQTQAGWATDPIVFRALCWGSHINFAFDYGDGYEEVIEGQLGSYSNYYGLGTHVYAAEGEFHVSVTAYNLLTNVTQTLGAPFIVVISPKGLSFDHPVYTFPFGNMSILTVTVDSGNNLFFNWSMGDQTNYLFAGPSVTHVYRTAASYNVTVVAFNKVQSLQTACTVDIVNFVSFVDLKVQSQLAKTYTDLFFTADTPANSAKWFKWDMGNGIPIKQTSVNTLTYRYALPGIYYVSVEAGNDMSNATSNPVEMTLQARIGTMIITTSAPALFGQRTVLEAQVYSGSNIEYVWSFGDGSPDVITEQSLVLHSYNRTGEYFISVFASNDVSNSSASTNIFILDEPCLAPELSIVGDSSRTINFSNPVKLEIEVFIDCDITQETTYQWSLVDTVDGSPLELNPNIASLDKRTLYIPGHVVPISSYTVTAEVRMNNTIVYSRTSMSLMIRESPLIAVIEGGTTRTIGRNTLAYINGGFSQDPDHPADSNLQYNWTCHLIDIPTEPCFDPSAFPNGSAPVPSANGSLVFPASWLRLDLAFQFVFYLTVSKEGRQPDVVSQVLKVVSNEKIYELLVDCPSCDEGIVNSNAELTLEALCPTCGDNSTFVWELFVIWDGSTTYTSSASRCIHADGSGPADSGTTAQTTLTPLTSSHVNSATNQASHASDTPMQQASSLSPVHTATPSQSPTSNQASPTASTGNPDGQGTSPSAGTSTQKASTPTKSPSSSPSSHSTTSSHSGPDWSSSSSIAESLPQSSFQEGFTSSSVVEYFSDDGGVFESVFEDSFTAAETKQDNSSDDLKRGRWLDAREDGTSTNTSVSAATGRSGFFEAASSSSSWSSVIAEGVPSSWDGFAEAAADDSSVAESFGFAEVISSSVAEVASSSSIQEEPPTVDASTKLPASTASLTTLDQSGQSEASSSVTGEAMPHTTTRQPGGGVDEDSLLESYSDSIYEYPDDSSIIQEEITPSITPTTKITSGPPTTRSSTTTTRSPVDNVDVEDISSIQEQDDSLYADYSSDGYEGEVSSLQSSANDGDPVANPDNPTTYEEHIVSRSSQAVVISEDLTTSGLKGRQFTLKPGYLEEGRTYAVGVKIYPEDGSPGVKAEAYQYVTVNEAPKLGICSISPDSGTELDTVFSAACHSWNDEDMPLQYEVRYSLNQSDPETILYYGMDRSVRFLLPAGHAENDHNVYLKLAIVDSKGGKTSVCDIAIPVSPKPFESLENKLEYLDAVSVGPDSMLAVYVAHGDDLNIHSHVRLVSHLLNQLSHVLVDEEEDADHCHIIAERCNIRSALLEGILELPIRDEYEILQVVGAINEVTSVPMELNAPCQRKVSGLLTTLATSSARCRWEESSLARDALGEMTMVASNILESFHHNHTDDILPPEDSRDITEKMVKAMIDMLQVYLGHMTTESEGVILTSPLLSVQGSRLGVLAGASFSAGGASFTLPPDLDALVGKPQAGQSWTDRYRWNHPCYDAHMVTYVDNPFMWGHGANKVTTPVASLELYSCDEDDSSLVNVSNLPAGEEIVIDIDNLSEELPLAYNYSFDPAFMSVHSFNVSRANVQQSFHISIKLTPIQRPIPITVLLRYGVEPTPTKFDLCWNHNDDINSIDIFLPPDSFNVSGRYYLALVDGEFGETVFRQEGDQTRQYLLKMWWGECLYWDASEVSWSPEGCSTSSSSTFATTQCLCTHLSSFGVSFVPILSIVSFVDMQLFVGPNENPVTYMFVAGLIGVYALLFVYCYYADRHDEKKQGLIYLKDNQPGDKQYYDITVETGFRTGAGTTARISIVLHGEEGHSETKELICDDKPIFERNSRDRFIISVPESLGNIQRLQLWHNNAGLSPGWYLSRISVRDLLTGQKWFFICERWFAVEEDDGKIERELLAVENGVGFTKAFFAKGAQYFADYYLWSSVFTRPPYSIFTRVQRLTCCLCISMGFMCVNTLWYQKLDKEESELGVIDVSGEAVLVGIVTALVAIPINFPLIMLFRRSKPWRMPGEIGELFKHIKSSNKHQSDPEEQTAAQLYNLQRWAREKWKHRHKSSIFKHLSENESSRSSIDAHSYSSGFGELTSEDRFRTMFTDSEMTSPELTESWESLDTEPIPSMKHKKLKSPKIWLPHFFYFIAWGGSIFIVIASSLVTIVLGLKFSYAQAIYWMQSMYFSFLQCIFITQPSVMAMLTIGKAWKHSNNIKIFDHYDDNTDLIDKRMLHRSRVQLYEQDLSKAIAARQRSRYLRFARPPQPKELQKAKEKMLKEKHMYAILKDVILFLILIFCVLWMAYGKETSLHGPLNNSVNQIFLKTTHPFTNVTTVDELWNWLQEDMVDTLYWQRWYNGDPIAENAGSVMITGESILLGRPSLRQLRVRPHTCTIPPVMRPLIGDCQGGYTASTYSREPYGPEDKWVFRTAHQLLRYCKWGLFTTYEGDGYAVDFNNTRDDAESLLWHLRNNSWIDAQTRAVILEFTLYNAPYNLFSAVAFVAEIPGSGAVYPLPKVVESVQLYRYEKPYDYFIMACELLFVLLVALISKQEIVKVVKQKRAYFRSAWSWVEMSLILVSITYFAMYVYRFAYVSEAGRRLKATYLEEFVDLSFLAWWDQRLRDLIGLILFIVTLKFLHLLRFNRMFAMFGAVFEAALGHLLLHMLCYTILETAFACLGNLLFGSQYYPFRNVYPAYEVISSLIVGSAPDHAKLWLLFPVLWPMFYMAYIICMVIFMAGLVKAILCHNYRKVKHCPLETVSGQEVISFFWHRFLCWLGIREEKVDDSDRDKLPMEFTMAEIQYQVDELVFRMNAILHQNGLPDKPFDYLDDSDATQNYHDDGISSYPSEDQEFDNEKFEERVQRLEEQLYFNNPELRELMTSPEDDDPDRHKGLRARLELEIFRQLQLSRQQDQLESDEPGVEGQDSGQMTASGSLASYDMAEESAFSYADLNDVSAGRPATAYRKDDGRVAFPQPMRNLGTLDERRANGVQRKSSTVQAWTDNSNDAPVDELAEEDCLHETSQNKRPPKKNILKRLPRPHTAAVFPIRDTARLSEDGEEKPRPYKRGSIQHKDSNTSTTSSSSAYSRRQSSDGLGSYVGSDSSRADTSSDGRRHLGVIDGTPRRGRNWKVTPFTKHGWEGEDLGESQSSERSGCSSHVANLKQNVSPPAPSRTNSQDSNTSFQIGSSKWYSAMSSDSEKNKSRGRGGRPSVDELVADHPTNHPEDHHPIGQHPNLTVSMESFPLPNSLEHLVVTDSSDNEKQCSHPVPSRSHKRRKWQEGGQPRASRLRKTKSRGKGKGRSRLQDVGHVNKGFSSDSQCEGLEDDHIPVIEMSKHLPGQY